MAPTLYVPIVCTPRRFGLWNRSKLVLWLRVGELICSFTWMDGWMKCYDCLRAPKITNSLNKSTMKNSRAKQPRHLVASWLARGLVIHSPPPPAPAGTDYYIQETSTSHQKPKLKQNRAEEEGELTNCQVELSVERSPFKTLRRSEGNSSSSCCSPHPPPPSVVVVAELIFGLKLLPIQCSAKYSTYRFLGALSAITGTQFWPHLDGVVVGLHLPAFSINITLSCHKDWGGRVAIII